MTKRELKNQIDQLRNDMAAEFVKRDKDIVATRTEVLKTRNAYDNALANLEKRLKNTEEFVGMQTDSIAAVILACGLREGDKFDTAYKQVTAYRQAAQEEKEKLHYDVVCDGDKHTHSHPAERKAIRLCKAAKLLGGLRAKSLDYLIERGAEGYRKGGRCYIYPDSIQNIKRECPHRKHEGYISVAQASKRAGISYTEAKAKCAEFGWPIVKFGKGEFIQEADCVRLVLKYKI